MRYFMLNKGDVIHESDEFAQYIAGAISWVPFSRYPSLTEQPVIDIKVRRKVDEDLEHLAEALFLLQEERRRHETLSAK